MQLLAAVAAGQWAGKSSNQKTPHAAELLFMLIARRALLVVSLCLVHQPFVQLELHP